MPSPRDPLKCSLDSEQGTFLNGVRIDRKTILKTGDTLRIGRLEFFVSVGPAEVAPPPIIKPQESAPQAVRDTVAMSAAGSDTVVDATHIQPPIIVCVLA